MFLVGQGLNLGFVVAFVALPTLKKKVCCVCFWFWFLWVFEVC